uniref:TctD-like protein n=1 Tax=Galaxaura rugosa TaxID=268570 RepID=A0A1G4NT78_9FLOR|nr:Hypothetical protein ycf29 [Galaxaura rugosa]SCW21847.1 Hypothetical protein ycf29 [Galaxaura rugosa]
MCYRILLVDDDVNLTSSIALYLLNENFKVETASNVEDALSTLNKFLPDIIITDIVMPEKDGYDFINLIKYNSQTIKIPVIFLTAKGMTQDRIRGYEMGCYGYLTKPFDPAELLSMTKSILMHVSPKIVHKINNKSDNINHCDNYLDPSICLTKREKTVLYCVLQGMTNKEIAGELNLTVRNIEKYVSRLLTKTKTRNRTHLSRYFYYKDNFINEGE